MVEIYMNEYEFECTHRYEGTYTLEEVNLNKALYKECIKDEIDLNVIEELLKKGADPLGATDVSGWGLLDHIYGEILCDTQNMLSKNLPQITEMFLKYGMDISKPRVPYDDGDSLNPMWQFAFVMNENSVYALQMLLDNGLSADDAGEMWGHATFDLFNLDCGDPSNDKFWNYECTWVMKLIMLCASYDHIIDNDSCLRNFIDFDKNRYDLSKFRKWNDFYYEFDTSHCERYPQFYKSIVRIFEVKSKKEVWKIVL